MTMDYLLNKNSQLKIEPNKKKKQLQKRASGGFSPTIYEEKRNMQELRRKEREMRED